jgi:hypothetical protein
MISGAANTVAAFTNVTLPLNSRIAGTPQEYYTVGKGKLQLFLNGQYLVKDAANGWSEVGSAGSQSSQIEILQALVNGDSLTFRSLL